MQLKRPRVTDSAARYKYSEGLEADFARISKFDDAKYNLSRRDEENNELLVPRNMAPLGHTLVVAEGTPINVTSTFAPRDKEQSRLVKEATAKLAEGRSFILQAPTGVGKTWMAMELIARVNRKTIVVVTKADVRDQWVAAAKTLLGFTDDDIGFMQGTEYPQADAKLVIASIQSLCREGKYTMEEFSEFGLVIVDECHRIGADQFSQAMWLLPAKLRLGLSATPNRADGKDEVLEGHIGKVEVVGHTMPMIPQIVVKTTNWRVPRWPGGGIMKHDFGKTMHIDKVLAFDADRNKMIAQFITKAAENGRKIIMFSSVKVHLAEVMHLLLKNGMKEDSIALYVGGMSKAQRAKAQEKQVLLATYAFTSEATDIPALDTCVLGTPRSNVVQIIGRILRQHPGKKQPLVLDVVDPASHVFSVYAKKRRKWYEETGANIIG